MTFSALFVGALLASQASAIPGRDNNAILKRACPDYVSYASTPQYVPLQELNCNDICVIVSKLIDFIVALIAKVH